jgi:disulfide bond formation protein DsbB
MGAGMLAPGPIAGNAARGDTDALRALLPLSFAMFALAAATILGALAFEHIGGYLPCALCLMQRTPYYAGLPVLAVAIGAILLKAPRAVVTGLFAVFAALMLYNTVLAGYHAGVEWGFWEGPASCAPSISIDSAADLMDQLENKHAPSCTQAALRILGLSFAGWNVLISGLLAALAVLAAAKAWRRA